MPRGMRSLEEYYFTLLAEGGGWTNPLDHPWETGIARQKRVVFFTRCTCTLSSVRTSPPTSYESSASRPGVGHLEVPCVGVFLYLMPRPALLKVAGEWRAASE